MKNKDMRTGLSYEDLLSASAISIADFSDRGFTMQSNGTGWLFK